MTEIEAIEAAWSFLSRESKPAVEFDSAQKILAASLPEHLRHRGDFWVVRFKSIVSEDIIESPGMILLDVDDTSGNVSVFDAL